MKDALLPEIYIKHHLHELIEWRYETNYDTIISYDDNYNDNFPLIRQH